MLASKGLKLKSEKRRVEKRSLRKVNRERDQNHNASLPQARELWMKLVVFNRVIVTKRKSKAT